jgi:hypothetical protein
MLEFYMFMRIDDSSTNILMIISKKKKKKKERERERGGNGILGKNLEYYKSQTIVDAKITLKFSSAQA